MELDYDKEIDALLRQKDFSLPSADAPGVEHLDANEIAAFAENALPGASRGNYMRHLASCDHCRKTVANVIGLNAEGDTVPLDPVIAPVVEKSAAPWYRGFFRFPGLAYAMGGLAVIFAAFLVFSIMRNTGGNRSAEISQVSEGPQPSATGPGAASDFPDTGSLANSAANTNAATDSMAETSEAFNAAANAALVGANAPAKPVNPEFRTAGRASGRFQEGGVTQSAPAPAAAAGSTSDSASGQPQFKDNNAAQSSERQLSEQRNENLPSMSKSSSGPRRDMNTQIQNSQNEAATLSGGAGKLAGPNGRHYLAGRVFEFRQGVWYDTNFSGQETVNYRRGTRAYRDLEPALQNAANYIGGTVVIVWKSKAYRIQ
ncbi:MAG: hypothetical protein ABI791_12420 [Acidobacteriota bacterium]